jgi:hypothetical protein
VPVEDCLRSGETGRRLLGDLASCFGDTCDVSSPELAMRLGAALAMRDTQPSTTVAATGVPLFDEK